VEEAFHQESVPLTPELERGCPLIQLDPEGAGELPSACEPGTSGDVLEGGIGVSEEGATEPDFQFQLFEGAPDQGARQILRPVGHQEDLLQVFDALRVKQVGDAHAEDMLGSEKKSVREGAIETQSRETFADRRHDTVTLLRRETGGWEGVSQFAEERRVETEPSRGPVSSAKASAMGPLAGDVLKELKLGRLGAIRGGPKAEGSATFGGMDALEGNALSPGIQDRKVGG
jgi:hypothetical protein